jgi:hypothetical protein
MACDWAGGTPHDRRGSRLVNSGVWGRGPGGVSPSGPEIAPDPPSPHPFCAVFAILSALPFLTGPFHPPFAQFRVIPARIMCLFRRFPAAKVGLARARGGGRGRLAAGKRTLAFYKSLQNRPIDGKSRIR